MIYFDLCVNFFEAFIFSYFIANYFDIRFKTLFIFLTTFLQLIFLTFISTPNSGIILSICIIVSILFMIFVFKHHITFDHILVVLTFNALIIVTSLVAILIEDVLHIYIFANSEIVGYIFRCCFSKILLYVISYYLMKNKVKYPLSLEFKHWGFVIYFDAILLSNLVLLTFMIVTNNFDSYMIYILLCFSVVMVMLYKYTIYKIDSMNKIEYNLKQIQQMEKLNNYKLMMIQDIKEDIDATDHRLFYIMFQLEYLLKNDKKDDALKLLMSYKSLLVNHHVMVDTGNSIFDFWLNIRINKMIMENIDISLSITISERENYNDLLFVKFITDMLQELESCKKIYLSIQEIDNKISINILYRGGIVFAEKIEDIITDFSITYPCFCNLDNHEKKGIRLVIKGKN